MEQPDECAPRTRRNVRWTTWTGVALLTVLPLLSVRNFARAETPAPAVNATPLASPPPAATDPAFSFDPGLPVSGSLVICGGGAMPPSVMERFLTLAGGPKARLVVVTTASTYAGTPDMELRLGYWRNLKVASLDVLHTRSRETADSPAFVKPLETATAVWFIGGNQNWITSVYEGTRTHEELRKLLRRGGVVAGTSAGAAMMSDVMIGGGRLTPTLTGGMGFLPGTIVDQHFLKRNREGRLVMALKERPGYVGIGIDESTALVVSGRKMEVVGDSEILVYLSEGAKRPLRTERFKAGVESDLVAWRRAAVERTRGVYPPSAFPPPKVEEGTLVIVGGGATPPEAVEKFIDAAGGADAPMVVVSNALGDETPAEEQVVSWLKKAGAKQVTQLHARSRADVADPQWLEPIRQAKGVWFTGGRQWRLVDLYLDTPVETLFHEVLKRGGVIGGTSAGASIQGDYLVRGNPLGNREISFEGYERGFGFLPGVAIDQHFSQRERLRDMTQLKTRYPQLIGLGIDESTALIVKGHTMQVVGEHQVTVFGPSRTEPTREAAYDIVKSGQAYDLLAGRPVNESVPLE